jgi:hypothetical protein
VFCRNAPFVFRKRALRFAKTLRALAAPCHGFQRCEGTAKTAALKISLQILTQCAAFFCSTACAAEYINTSLHHKEILGS